MKECLENNSQQPTDTQVNPHSKHHTIILHLYNFVNIIHVEESTNRRRRKDEVKPWK